jgi:hypothetical protein
VIGAKAEITVSDVHILIGDVHITFALLRADRGDGGGASGGSLNADLLGKGVGRQQKEGKSK